MASAAVRVFVLIQTWFYECFSVLYASCACWAPGFLLTSSDSASMVVSCMLLVKENPFFFFFCTTCCNFAPDISAVSFKTGDCDAGVG